MSRFRKSKWLSVVISSLVVIGSMTGCGQGGSQGDNSSSSGTMTDSSAAVSVDDILTDVIEIEQSDSYQFDAEEIMYLSGVKATAYTPGTQYTLRDLDGDSISELLISVGETIGVYAYDESTNQAKSTTEYDDKIDELLDDPEVVWVDSESQWVDGSIFGVAKQTGDPGVKTDFYTSSCYDWLTDAKVAAQGDSVASIDSDESIEEKMIEIFNDRDNYKDEDIERIRGFYDIATNWDKRNEEGIEPVKKYFEAIESIDSLSSMDEYLANPELDPFVMFMTFYITLDVKDTSEYIVKLQGDEFSILPRMYNNEEEEDRKLDRTEYDMTARYVLEKAGYASSDVDRIMEEFYEIENQLLEKDWPSEEEDESDELLQTIPIEEMASKCENFPLGKLFEAYGISGGKATVEYPEYLRTLDALYTEENLSKLKSYALAHTAYEASSYLDLDTRNAYYNNMAEEATSQDAEEEYGASAYTEEALNDLYMGTYLSGKDIMGVAAENAYITNFVDDEEREDISELANEIKDTFREILENEEWMSEEGKKAAIAKLDNMEFSILRPDTLIDSSYLEVDKDSNYLDAYAALKVNTKKHNGEFVGKERVKGDWRYDLFTDAITTEDNCYYYGALNQFFILDAFINDNTYRLDMTREEKLGTLGEVIGHELTHGFDPNGIQYDKDGNMVVTDDNPYGWMPEEDYNAFMDRANKLSEYFSEFTPYPYNRCDGSLYWGEAAADIAGMSIGLKIASKYDDFDYDTYFRSHAALWVVQTTLIVEQGDIFNEHPLYYLRINATCQQFDEFFETYDIKEGDLMYLAPEDRISIW